MSSSNHGKCKGFKRSYENEQTNFLQESIADNDYQEVIAGDTDDFFAAVIIFIYA